MECYARLVHYSTCTEWNSDFTKRRKKDKTSHPLSTTLIVISIPIFYYNYACALLSCGPEVSVWFVELVSGTTEPQLPFLTLISVHKAKNVVLYTKQFA